MRQQWPMADMVSEQAIEATVLRLVAERGLGKSICPSEAARALAPEWNALMGPVRRVAVRLAQAGRIEILRKGKPVDPAAELRGVIRLRLAGPGVAETGVAETGCCRDGRRRDG